MKINKGSVLPLANGTFVTLEKDAEISFPNSHNEGTQIGFLQVTGNYEPTELQKAQGWPANKDRFKFKRDANGNVLSLEEQVAEGQTVEDFILRLSRADAEYLGVTERQAGLKEAAAAEKAKAKGK